MMNSARKIREVGYFDCVGGGQVALDGTTAYIGHMTSPHGTSIVDVSDPRDPRLLAHLEMHQGFHSHKVRVRDGIMVTNRERVAGPHAEGIKGGIGIYDVSKPSNPRQIYLWETGGKGVHKFDFDGRYVYLSTTSAGFVSNIVLILDLQDPEQPEEVGRWWMPGQWEAGGEEPTWGDGVPPRCHHPLRLGDRLYTSYWHHGFVILDIEDMSNPRFVSGLDWSPPFAWPTHTALPIPVPIQGRKLLVVADEDVAHLWPSYPSFLWIVDITDETRPVPFASFQVAGIDGSPQPEMTGCHQPCERVMSAELPVAWFAHGLRIIDISNPHTPREVAFYMPPVPAGSDRVQSNDVSVDDRGLIYLLDRVRGLHILERI